MKRKYSKEFKVSVCELVIKDKLKPQIAAEKMGLNTEGRTLCPECAAQWKSEKQNKEIILQTANGIFGKFQSTHPARGCDYPEEYQRSVPRFGFAGGMRRTRSSNCAFSKAATCPANGARSPLTA